MCFRNPHGMNSVHAACDLLLPAPTNSTAFRLWESRSSPLFKKRTSVNAEVLFFLLYNELLPCLRGAVAKRLRGIKKGAADIPGWHRSQIKNIRGYSLNLFGQIFRLHFMHSSFDPICSKCSNACLIKVGSVVSIPAS